MPMIYPHSGPKQETPKARKAAPGMAYNRLGDLPDNAALLLAIGMKDTNLSDFAPGRRKKGSHAIARLPSKSKLSTKLASAGPNRDGASKYRP